MVEDFQNIWVIIMNILSQPIDIWGFHFTWLSVIIWSLLASLVCFVLNLLFNH